MVYDMRACCPGGSITAGLNIVQLFWNDELLDLCGTFKRLNGKHCSHPLLSDSTPGAMAVPICAFAGWGRSLWLRSRSPSTTWGWQLALTGTV